MIKNAYFGLFMAFVLVVVPTAHGQGDGPDPWLIFEGGGGPLPVSGGEGPVPLKAIHGGYLNSTLKVDFEGSDTVRRVPGSLIRLKMSLTFYNKDAKEQSFYNYEYQFLLCDENGEQVTRAVVLPLGIRLIKLTGRSTKDNQFVFLDADKLGDGQKYHLVCAVRNLGGIASFTTTRADAKKSDARFKLDKDTIRKVNSARDLTARLHGIEVGPEEPKANEEIVVVDAATIKITKGSPEGAYLFLLRVILEKADGTPVTQLTESSRAWVEKGSTHWYTFVNYMDVAPKHVKSGDYIMKSRLTVIEPRAIDERELDTSVGKFTVP